MSIKNTSFSYDDFFKCQACGKRRGGGSKVDHSACGEKMRAERPAKEAPEGQLRVPAKPMSKRHLDYLCREDC